MPTMMMDSNYKRRREQAMKQFRILFNNGMATDWQDASEWTLEEMSQWKEFGNYQIEWR